MRTPFWQAAFKAVKTPRWYNARSSILFTTLFCVLVALVTQTIWPSPLIEHLMISIGYGYSYLVCSLLLYWRLPAWPQHRHTLVALATSMLVGSASAYAMLSKYPQFAHLTAMRPIVVLAFIFTGVCSLYFYHREQQRLAQQALAEARHRQTEQDKALLLSQLKQLQSQIEPHFLFNTLATIHALIMVEPQTAQQMLGKLTALLRGSLRRHRQTLVPLAEELALVEAYLEIQQIRLGERLTYRLPQDSELGQLQFPPLLLQPLVENAVVHGIEPKAEGGEVQISLSLQDEQLELAVSDNGVGLAPNLSDAASDVHSDAYSAASRAIAGSHIALENIRQRLAGLFGHAGELRVQQNARGGVTATLRIDRRQLSRLPEGE
ncbi:MAG: sensor histidine kinase [Plesiomonas shigelloides]